MPCQLCIVADGGAIRKVVRDDPDCADQLVRVVPDPCWRALALGTLGLKAQPHRQFQRAMASPGRIDFHSRP